MPKTRIDRAETICMGNRRMQICRSGALAVVGTSALAFLQKPTGVPTYSVLYLAVLVAEWLLTRRFLTVPTPQRGKRLGIAFGWLFALAFLTGLQLQYGQFVGSVWNGAALCLAATGLSPLIALAYLRLGSLLDERLAYTAKDTVHLVFRTEKRLYYSCMLGLLLAWLPVFLAYYPGLFAYDVPWQLSQSIEGYTTHHPLLHTLLLQAFYWLGGRMGSYANGMALYCMLQMLALSASLAYLMRFLYRRQIQRGVCIAVFAWMALMPLYSVLAISMTKDVLFAAVFLLLFIQLCEYALDARRLWSKGFCLSLVLLMIGCGLLRNNGVYVVIISVLAGLLYAKRDERRRFLMVGLMGIAMMLLAGQALKLLTDARRGSRNEFLNVPYQQIARVYVMDHEELSEEDRALIETVMPDVGQYEPHNADYVKYNASASGYERALAKLYPTLLIKHFDRYVEAFLLNTMGLWYLDDVSASQIYGQGIENRTGGYLMTEMKAGFGVEHKSLLPFVEKLYERLLSANDYQKIPLYGALFRLALFFWLNLLGITYAIERRVERAVAPLALLLSLMLTLLLGPCVLARYAFPYIVCVPVLYAMLFSQRGVLESS